MFTGIIEEKAILVDITSEGSNLKLTFESPISGKLKIDQSIAHNGVCLTVVSFDAKDFDLKMSVRKQTHSCCHFRNN